MDDWEQRKLKQVFSRFIVPMRDKPNTFSGTIPWTRVEDVKGKYLGDSLSGLCVSSEMIQKMHLQIFPKSSIAVTISATFGVVAITKKDLVTNQRFIGLVPEIGNDIEFLYELCKSPSLFKQMQIESAGSVHFYITRHQMENFHANVPIFEEQSKISGLLSSLDKSCALHERKLELLKELKKAYLQKLFPENGNKIPQLRFVGFADDWEQRKLGDFFPKVLSGNRLPKTQIQPGKVPYVIATKDNNGVGAFVSADQKDFSGNTMKMFPADSITASIDNPEAIFLQTKPFVASNVMRVLHSDRLTFNQMKVLLEVLRARTNGFDWSIKFSGPVIQSLEFMSPSDSEEREQIGQFISNLDNTIALHQRKLESLRNLKKAYLQRLFV